MALQRSLFERWYDDAQLLKSSPQKKKWETNERVFNTGLELIASPHDLNELYNSFQTSYGNRKDCDLDNLGFHEFVEIVKIWNEDNAFCLLDLTLYTLTSTETGNKVFYWKYRFGDNHYGTYHFLLKDEPRSSSIHFISNMDGDLSFLGEAYDKFVEIESWFNEPLNHEIENLLAFYNTIEDNHLFSYNSIPV